MSPCGCGGSSQPVQPPPQQGQEPQPAPVTGWPGEPGYTWSGPPTPAPETSQSPPE